MSTKTIVNKALKEAGLEFIKIKDGSSSFSDSKCMTDYDGKRMKGIYCTSHSPMDVTSAASDCVREVAQSVHSKMVALLGKPEGDSSRYIVAETSRSITYLYLATERHRTYSWKANLDDGYQTTYLVPYITTEKK